MRKETITAAKALAASVVCVEGFRIDVGQYADFVTVNGKNYSGFIRTYKGKELVRTRVFKTRKEQCEYLRGRGAKAEGMK